MDTKPNNHRTCTKTPAPESNAVTFTLVQFAYFRRCGGLAASFSTLFDHTGPHTNRDTEIPNGFGGDDHHHVDVALQYFAILRRGANMECLMESV